jgi:23S rRNA (pseudouridine1915-N3)-methyltransferase
VIGGPYGVSQEVLDRADIRLSFSKMTFTHQMIRVFLLEQIYRGFAIMKGKSYHY